MNAPLRIPLIPAIQAGDIPARFCANCHHYQAEGTLGPACAKSSVPNLVTGVHRMGTCSTERAFAAKGACGPEGLHYMARLPVTTPRLLFIEDAIVAAQPDFVEASELLDALQASLKHRPEAELLANAFQDLRDLLAEVE